MDKDLIPQAMLLAEEQAALIEGAAVLDGAPVELTQVESRLLSTLASEPGRVFSRSEILRSLYSDHRVVCERTVDAHVKNLRRKLRALRAKWLVRSLYGLGYMLDLGA